MSLAEILNKLSPGEKRFFLVTCIAATLLVTGWILFSSNGVMNHRTVQKQLQAVQNENLKLAAENEQLKIEIEKLKSDPAYLEEVARKDYGLVKKNEMIFDFD
ncbi:MAG: septum formation initiator family protein [Deltaproteobacteria bacterium]|nr:septum formation initiator family protein [Deltaproteobacteria bacterium]